jgi:hypothetical protein
MPDKPTVKTPVPTIELGRSGLNQFNGYIDEEFVPELTGEKWKWAVREMTDQDSVIGSLLFAIEMLIRQVEFKFVSSEEDNSKSEKIAEFFNQALHDMENSWSDTLSEILSFLPWGWSYFEKVYKYRKGDAPGTSVTEYSRYTDGKIAWRKWGIRSQESLLRWEYNDNTGELIGMVQNSPPHYQTVLIPAWKAIHFRSSSKKDSPEGKSILRSAWRSWHLKKRIENMEAVSIEKNVVGMPVFWVPVNIITGTEPDEVQARLNYEKIAKNLKTDEQRGLVMPLSYDDSGNKEYDVTLLSPNSSSGQTVDTNTVVARHDRNIAMSVIADFMVMGHGSSTGSFALASSKTELFAKAVGAWMDNICETINKQAVPDLMALNGWDRKYSPKMIHGDIETLDLTELGSYVQKLALAGLPIFNNPDVINYLLEQAGIPTMTEEEIQKAIEDSQAPGGGQPDTGGLLPGQNGYQGPNAPIVTQQKNPSTAQKKKPVIQRPNAVKIRQKAQQSISGD